MTTSKRRWPIISRGGHEQLQNWSGYSFLCQVGELDLLFRDTSYNRYAVVCDPSKRKRGRWNSTVVEIEGGALDFADDDVELDPYHMCLLHQAIEAHCKENDQ